MSATEAVLSVAGPRETKPERKPKGDAASRIKQLISNLKGKDHEIAGLHSELSDEREARRAAEQKFAELEGKVSGFTAEETNRLQAQQELENKKRELYTTAIIACSRETGIIRYAPDFDKRFEQGIVHMSTQLLFEVLKVQQLGQNHNPAAVCYSLCERPDVCARLSEWCKSFETIGDCIRALYFLSLSITGEVALLTAAMPAQGEKPNA